MTGKEWEPGDTVTVELNRLRCKVCGAPPDDRVGRVFISREDGSFFIHNVCSKDGKGDIMEAAP